MMLLTFIMYFMLFSNLSLGSKRQPLPVQISPPYFIHGEHLCGVFIIRFSVYKTYWLCFYVFWFCTVDVWYNSCLILMFISNSCIPSVAKANKRRMNPFEKFASSTTPDHQIGIKSTIQQTFVLCGIQLYRAGPNKLMVSHNPYFYIVLFINFTLKLYFVRNMAFSESTVYIGWKL